MESLTRLSLKGVCSDKVVDYHKGLSLNVGLSKSSENCFLGLLSSNLVHISLFSVQRKTIQPIFCVQTPATQSEETATKQSVAVRVKFRLHKDCSFGQNFLLVGDDPVLGSWNPSNAVPLEWSEGHVWSVELDIPSGKTISYKFILKGEAETILWQQGPDRTLETWETNKVITVSEDWDNSELQKIVEESEVNSETLVAENVVQTTADLENDGNEENTNQILAIVAENISDEKDDVYTDESSSSASNIIEDTTMEAKSIDKNATAFNDEALSSKDESILGADEKVAVLVPGLTQILNIGESSVGSNNEELNVLLDEVHTEKAVAEGSIESKSEEFNVAELSLKEELAPPKDIEKSELVQGRDRSMEGSVIGRDLQWGKRTLNKLFASLGFFKVELER